jgi:endoglycosylceramidase
MGPIPPLSASGRWLVDAAGRVVMLHGFNEVAKSAPFYPAAFGFGDDDAAFLAGLGFDAVRLGVLMEGLMPAPGEIDDDYVEHLAETVDMLASHGIFVLLDFHQDGFGPLFRGDGLPDWMAITDGLPNPPDATFPLYYVQNPAMQRAFEHVWASSPAPDGVGLQDHYVQGMVRVAERFAGNPWVLGYEVMNEPWPGATWQPCLMGCPDLEQNLLAPFYGKATDAVRAVAPAQLVFVEPFVLFNFGGAPMTMPGTAAGNALSFHSYALDVNGEQSVVAQAVAAAERDRAPVLATEFGATLDPLALGRITDEMDAALVPWLDWAYNESIIADATRPAGPDNVRSADALAALLRPYPTAIAGIPTEIAFDRVTKTFTCSFTPPQPASRDRRGRVTVIQIPTAHYPDGYVARVQGAWIASPRCASRLVLCDKPRAAMVSVRVTSRPASRACRHTIGAGT